MTCVHIIHFHMSVGRINGYCYNSALGLVRDLNPGPLAPEARIIPLDQRASATRKFTSKSNDVVELSKNRRK